MRNLGWLIGFGTLALIGCSSSVPGDGAGSEPGALGENSDGVEVADRLFEGTISGSDATSGVCTFVVRSTGDVEAVITSAKSTQRFVGTMSSSGKLNLHAASTTSSSTTSPSIAPPPASCQVLPKSASTYCPIAGEGLCGEGHCCPSETPYGCASSGKCYASSAEAAANCGSSCLACGAAPASGGQSSSSSGPSVGGQSSSNGSVSGELDGTTLTGRFEDPNGGGGVFTAQDATKKPVTKYCGTFSGSDHGTWNLQGGGSSVSGSFQGELASGLLNGKLEGSSLSLTFSGDASGEAPGTVSGSSVSGTWRTSDGGYSGTWSGSTSACVGAGGGSGSTKAGNGCCTVVNRGGKMLTACCIEGCRADGSCASAAGG
jgi:hypothetical protein